MISTIRTLQFLSFFLATTFTIAQDFSAFQYRNVGPQRGGRVTTVTGIPQHPGTFYLGATGGGVWKSTDYGTSWENVSDGFFETPSIGAIEVAPTDPNIVYVGTGSDGLRSNVISGKGVYKSIDAGKTWEHIGLRNVGQIGAVEIDPTDHNIVWVAAIGNAFKDSPERGIYKTTNGGQTWEKVLFISDKVGFADLELLPGNPNIVYAAAWKGQRKPWTIISGGENAEGGIYKSINAGKDWVKLSDGLPQGLIGKIDLAVSPVDSSILYAVIEAPGQEGGLYKSVNQGKSFVHVSNNKGLVNRPFYYTNLELDPTNPDIIYSNANPLLKSTNGGISWTEMSVPHGDNHDIWLNPNNPDLLIQANDGGANVSHNGGKTWSTQFNQPTAEIYQVEVDDQYPYWLYGGQQDNYTTVAVPSFPPYAIQDSDTGWIINTGGCETGPAVPKPGNHNIVYANCKGRFGVFDKRTGTEKSYYVGASNIYGHNPKDLEYRFQRVAPIHVSPHNPDVVYHGSQYVHKTTDDGITWETISPDLTAFETDKQVISGSPITRDITGEEYYSTLYSIRESPVQQGVIWTGSNDGVVSVTTNGGTTWENVTPKKLPKGGRVESIEPSRYNPAKAYIAVDMHLMGDNAPYLFKTENYGKTWERISDGNGIPADYTTRVLREDPEKPGLLYAGTEYGMFLSLNDGATWVPFQQNLPVTPITDIKLVRGDLVLSTMGRGFWILDNITPLRDAAINKQGEAPVLFKPQNTIRYRYPMVSHDGFPEYPRTNVAIDYYLPNGVAAKDLQLEIRNAANQTVATILSDTTVVDGNVSEEDNMMMSRTYRYADAKLANTPGINRFQWDLRKKGPWAKDAKRRYKNGPMVPPGDYTAVLTVNGKTLSHTFQLQLDPRAAASGLTQQHIERQVELQQEAIELLSKARKLQVELEDALAKTNTPAEKERLEALLNQLKNAEGAYPQQMLIAQIEYVYGMLSGADQRPGQDTVNRLQALQTQFNNLQNQAGPYAAGE